jgi:hypothetical protein
MMVIAGALAHPTTRSSFRSLFISPIKTFPGPPGTATGEPGALTNNGCCNAFEGTLGKGQEIKNDIEEAASNNANRAK